MLTNDANATPNPGTDAINLERRDFVRAAVGSGFAAAVLPVTAQTIRTDSAGLSVGEVTIEVGNFKMPAYRAMPTAAGGAVGNPLPVVLVISEIFGVHEHIADVARRFARLAIWPLRPNCSCARAMRSRTARSPS